MVVQWIDTNGLNPVAGAIGGGAVAGPPGAFIGAAIGIGIGIVIGDKMFSKENRPPGAIDAIAGSKEWGKRNGVGGRKAVDIFHDIKKGNRGIPGSKVRRGQDAFFMIHGYLIKHKGKEVKSLSSLVRSGKGKKRIYSLPAQLMLS